jgi:hypothetical protein
MPQKKQWPLSAIYTQSQSNPIEDNGQPVVFTVMLPDELNRQVKPDVGAASLLLLKEGENFMAYLTDIYQTNSLDGPDIDLMQAERNEYLRILGMAYINADIEALHIKLITDES